MIQIKYNITPVRFALGGGVIAISAGMVTHGSAYGLKWLFLPLGTCLFAFGILLFLTGIFEITQNFKLMPKWDDKSIRRALMSAPPASKIRILQTWLPDKEDFCPFLEELLIDGEKQFKLEVLLINCSESNGLLDARIKLRSENRDMAQQAIKATITRLSQLKQKVDAAWVKKYSGAKLNIEIRSYEFMPFGPLYQVGKNKMFLGFYINFESSAHGPMLLIQNSKSRIWKLFEEDFMRGWEDAKKITKF